MSKAKRAPRVKKPLTFTVATTEMAAYDPSVADEKLRFKLTTTQFGQQLSVLAGQVKEIKRLSLEVGKRGELPTKDGQKVGRRELTKMTNDYIKSLRTLKKNYSAQARKKPRSALTKEGKPRKQGKGLSGAVFVQAPLKNFLLSTNYGPRDAEVKAIIQPLLAQDVISRAIVGALLGLWSKQNKFTVMEDGKQKSYFRADDAMTSNLGPYLQQTGAKYPGFDQSRFKYARLQNIVNPGILTKGQLNAQQLQYTEDAGVQQILNQAKAQVSAINKSA